jgi:hypothetical protein
MSTVTATVREVHMSKIPCHTGPSDNRYRPQRYLPPLAPSCSHLHTHRHRRTEAQTRNARRCQNGHGVRYVRVEALLRVAVQLQYDPTLPARLLRVFPLTLRFFDFYRPALLVLFVCARSGG